MVSREMRYRHSYLILLIVIIDRLKDDIDQTPFTMVYRLDRTDECNRCVISVRIAGPVHYRGLLIQPRLTDTNGYLIGSLTGGRFINDDSWIDYGIRYQICDGLELYNDSITHSDERKKFLTQIKWITDVDVGAVQFLYVSYFE